MAAQAELCVKYHNAHPTPSGGLLSLLLGSATPRATIHAYDFLSRYDFSQPLPAMKDDDFNRLWADESEAASSETDKSKEGAVSLRSMKAALTRAIKDNL